MLNCLTRLGFSLAQMHEIECMTLVEYHLGMEAYAIKKALRNDDMATQAWLNNQVKATKGSSKNPKPAYEKFTDFYDVESVEDDIRSEFEPDYVPKREVKVNEQDEYIKRWNKIIANRKRKGV